MISPKQAGGCAQWWVCYGHWPPNGHGARPLVQKCADQWGSQPANGRPMAVAGGQWALKTGEKSGQLPTIGMCMAANGRPMVATSRANGRPMAKKTRRKTRTKNPETALPDSEIIRKRPMVVLFVQWSLKNPEKNPDNGPSFSGLESFFPFLPPSPDFLRSLRIFQFFGARRKIRSGARPLANPTIGRRPLASGK